MSCCGYFSKTKETRMPKGDNGLGIDFHGPVMSGRKSVEQARRESDLLVMQDNPGFVRERCYKTLEDYDPVLRAHCRLPERRK